MECREKWTVRLAVREIKFLEKISAFKTRTLLILFVEKIMLFSFLLPVPEDEETFEGDSDENEEDEEGDEDEEQEDNTQLSLLKNTIEEVCNIFICPRLSKNSRI